MLKPIVLVPDVAWVLVGFDASYESLILLIGEIGIHREVVAYAVT